MRTLLGSTTASRLRGLFCLILSLMMAVAFQISVAPDADAKKARGNPKYAAYVIDAKTGKVLHSRNGHSKRYPASLTKMMTVYLMFEDLASGRIKKSTRLVMSRAGARREPSKLGLRVGQTISMEQAIYSLVTKSANDVATAVGDQLSGSEKKFAERMTRKARQLGMKNTTFRNANGLTARGQLTTAADMARLGLALREHFPRQYKYFQTRVFKFGKRRYRNHNRLLGQVRGVDGIKTGYTRASGFNLVSSVSANGRKIVAVVMGGRTGRSRNAQMAKLIRTFLPKASRGGARRLVAKPKSFAPIVASRIATPSIAKKASRRISLRINEAHAGKVKAGNDVVAIRKKLASLAGETMPVPVLRKTLTPAAPVDKATTAAVEKPQRHDGWQIQIAASDDRTKALNLLKVAKSKNKRLLADASAVTQTVVKNGTKLYRARFVGFSSKASARRACQVLKRQRYACLALHG